jgi:L-threonylcarbamoyladenylate synthase
MMDAAVAAVRAGQCIGLPTETVYGLAVDATNGPAVARLYALKGRPSFNPLIVHVADADTASQLIEMSPAALALADAFWPGPLTLVGVRRPRAGIADLVTAGLETLAVRVPAHPMAQAFLRAFGGPVAAPSANRSGTPSPTTAAHVVADFGTDGPVVLDGGPCAAGLESTVVDVTTEPAVILRLGALPRDAIAAVVRLADGTGAAARSPGRLARHYAPAKPLRLNVTAPDHDEAYLSFGTPSPYSLSGGGDLIEAAANLYAQLRAADASAYPRIAVAPIPQTGLGEALNDRLVRAAGMVG